MSASSTTFMPISGSTTERRASRTASSRERMTGSIRGVSSSAGAMVGPMESLVMVGSDMVAPSYTAPSSSPPAAPGRGDQAPSPNETPMLRAVRIQG